MLSALRQKPRGKEGRRKGNTGWQGGREEERTDTLLGGKGASSEGGREKEKLKGEREACGRKGKREAWEEEREERGERKSGREKWRSQKAGRERRAAKEERRGARAATAARWGGRMELGWREREGAGERGGE